MTPVPGFLYPVMSFFWRIVSYRNPVWSHRCLPGCVALWVNRAGWLWDSCGSETAALSLTHSLSHTPCKMTLCRQAAVLRHDLVGSWELTTTWLPQSFRSLASQGLIPRRAAHCRRGPAAAAGTHTSVKWNTSPVVVLNEFCWLCHRSWALTKLLLWEAR